MDVSSIALQGVQQAQLQVEASAQRLASTGSANNVDSVNLSQEAVSLVTAKNQFAANINVLKIADSMQKSVINLLG